MVITQNLPVLLQIEEGDGVAVPRESILGDDGDVVGAKVQMAQPVQGAQGVGGDYVKAVVS